MTLPSVRPCDVYLRQAGDRLIAAASVVFLMVVRIAVVLAQVKRPRIRWFLVLWLTCRCTGWRLRNSLALS